MENNNIAKNLKYGKIFSSACNFIAGALFIFAYFLRNNYIFLITGLVIILLGFVIISFFNRVGKRLLNSDFNKQEQN